nr:hypothetical protein TetV2_00571 [Oceanusvirus sp.]
MFGTWILSAVTSVLWGQDEEVLGFHRDLASRRRHVTSEELIFRIAELEDRLNSEITSTIRKQNADMLATVTELKEKVKNQDALLRKTSANGLCSLNEAYLPLYEEPEKKAAISDDALGSSTPSYSEPKNHQLRFLPKLFTVPPSTTPFNRSSLVPPPSHTHHTEAERIKKELEKMNAAAAASGSNPVWGGIEYDTVTQDDMNYLKWSGCTFEVINKKTPVLFDDKGNIKQDVLDKHYTKPSLEPKHEVKRKRENENETSDRMIITDDHVDATRIRENPESRDDIPLWFQEFKSPQGLALHRDVGVDNEDIVENEDNEDIVENEDNKEDIVKDDEENENIVDDNENIVDDNENIVDDNENIVDIVDENKDIVDENDDENIVDIVDENKDIVDENDDENIIDEDIIDEDISEAMKEWNAASQSQSNSSSWWSSWKPSSQ